MGERPNILRNGVVGIVIFLLLTLISLSLRILLETLF
jgi:hypothetical protein